MIRVSAVERSVKRHAVSAIAAATGMSNVAVSRLLKITGRRVAEITGVRRAVRVRGDHLRVVDCAGLLRVSPGIELEVTPKFLEPSDPTWREDFFLIATLSRAGHILPRDRIRTAEAGALDLATLVGGAMVDLFWQNQRRPVRVYRRRTRRDFAIDGDVEAEELFLPDPDGFSQDVVLFDRENSFNATIRAAAQCLLPEVRHSETRMHLLRVFERLSPQDSIVATPRDRVLPTRHRAWQPLYDLSVQVLRGFGADYSAGALHGPGFILTPWSAWQDLVFSAVREGFPHHHVQAQEPFVLGARGTRPLRVRPDVTIRPLGNQTPSLLVDAKYKIAASKGRLRITEADVYEALAFLRASGTSQAILLYPREPQSGPRLESGTSVFFESVQVGEYTIRGGVVECRGVAAAGLGNFGRTLAASIKASVESQI